MEASYSLKTIFSDAFEVLFRFVCFSKTLLPLTNVVGKCVIKREVTSTSLFSSTLREYFNVFQPTLL